MKPGLHIALALVVGLSLTACVATPPSIYYWGDYSETAYQLKKEPSEKTKQAHQACLEDIVAHAVAKNKRIPPGIYAELALLQLEDGLTAEAFASLQQEKKLFPESATLVDVLQQKMTQRN